MKQIISSASSLFFVFFIYSSGLPSILASSSTAPNHAAAVPFFRSVDSTGQKSPSILNELDESHSPYSKNTKTDAGDYQSKLAQVKPAASTVPSASKPLTADVSTAATATEQKPSTLPSTTAGQPVPKPPSIPSANHPAPMKPPKEVQFFGPFTEGLYCV
jgi:hypothetical protein